jgi:hypothetical protein
VKLSPEIGRIGRSPAFEREIFVKRELSPAGVSHERISNHEPPISGEGGFR